MRALALDAETRALLAVYEVEARVERVFADLAKAQAKVVEQGEEARRPNLGILRESWGHWRGEAFWDRSPLEPTPTQAPQARA